jgi:KipI family sensor histidine kinase inhibitor
MAPVGQYLRYSTVFDAQANLRVLALAAALAAGRPDGVREIYPGYGSVYVEWDDARLSNSAAKAWIDAALEAPEEARRDPAVITVPVRYGGLDTDDVADRTGLAHEQIAKLHAEVEYRVCARATVGQPMMGVTDEHLRVPRRPSPRTDVPALAVAIANEQATIYPALMPGGWNVIGTALENVYDPHRDEPFAFGLGDRVRIKPSDGEPPAPPERRPLLPEEPRHPALRVEEPGALDLLLDGGRLNQAHHGMAQSGPLDARAASLANRLAGNASGTALIESTLSGPTLLALRDVIVGAAGRGLRLHVDDEPVGQVTTLVR